MATVAIGRNGSYCYICRSISSYALRPMKSTNSPLRLFHGTPSETLIHHRPLPVAVTHYFSYLKAKQELGYIPLVSSRKGMARTISYWQDRKRTSLDGPTIYAWLFCVIGMTSLFAASFLPDVGPVPPMRRFALFFFRSLWAVRLVFILSVAVHIGEAIYALQLAKRVDPSNVRGWFWQTLALGIFSLRFLLKRARNHVKASDN